MGQMIYKNEGKSPGNLVLLFLHHPRPSKVTRGQPGSPKVTNLKYRSNDRPNGRKFQPPSHIRFFLDRHPDSTFTRDTDFGLFDQTIYIFNY